MAMAIAMMVVASMPVKTQRAVHRSHPRTNGATDNGANRSSGSIAFMRAFLRTTYEPLSLHAERPRQHGEKSNGQCKT
jgi:hypothetical protein